LLVLVTRAVLAALGLLMTMGITLVGLVAVAAALVDMRVLVGLVVNLAMGQVVLAAVLVGVALAILLIIT
jgi:hypothetical protein